MKKRVIVTVKSVQMINGEDEVIELISPGKFYKKGNIFYVIYEETELSGMQGTTTTLKIEEKCVTLMRFGTTSTCMRFEEGVKSRVLYKVPYGMVEFTIKPESIEVDVNEDGGEVHLYYGLKAAGHQTSTNELHIKIQ